MIINKVNDIFIIYIYKDNFDDVDIFNYNDLSCLFKIIINKIKRRYNINGFCDVNVYVDNNFGMIIEINNNCFDKVIDMKIKFHMDYIFFNEISCFWDYDDVFYFKNKLYTPYKKEIDSNVIYKESLDILNNGIKIK